MANCYILNGDYVFNLICFYVFYIFGNFISTFMIFSQPLLDFTFVIAVYLVIFILMSSLINFQLLSIFLGMFSSKFSLDILL